MNFLNSMCLKETAQAMQRMMSYALEVVVWRVVYCMWFVLRLAVWCVVCGVRAPVQPPELVVMVTSGIRFPIRAEA